MEAERALTAIGPTLLKGQGHSSKVAAIHQVVSVTGPSLSFRALGLESLAWRPMGDPRMAPTVPHKFTDPYEANVSILICPGDLVMM